MEKIKIFFSEWTESELCGQPRCHCDCHAHPGTYPTSEEKPCSVCGHVHIQGYFPGYAADGWVEYWRSDKAGLYAKS